MPVELNHTIVQSHDKKTSATFLAEILGLGSPGTFSHFVTVQVANGVSLDFDNADEVRPQHYAFVVEDDEFDPIFERIKDRGITFYAYPGHQDVGQINTRRGGRGFYFDDPSGHHMEVLTRSSLAGAS